MSTQNWIIIAVAAIAVGIGAWFFIGDDAMAPVADAPAIEAPAVEAPAIEAPAVEAPATDG